MPVLKSTTRTTCFALSEKKTRFTLSNQIPLIPGAPADFAGPPSPEYSFDPLPAIVTIVEKAVGATVGDMVFPTGADVG
jgi:hypothetical protein